MLQASETLIEEARDLLQLHHQELPRSLDAMLTSIEAAIDAIAQAVELIKC